MTRGRAVVVVATAATALASSALHPLFADLSWVPWVLGAIILAAVAGALTRRFAPAGPIVIPGVLALYVTVAFAPSTAIAGVVPTGRTAAAIHTLTSAAVTDIQERTAPVPVTDGLLLLAVAGVYLIAVLVDLLAVTARRPALAGLPLLLLVAFPEGITETIGVVPFVLAAVGWLALLLLDGRGRLESWAGPSAAVTVSAATTPGPPAGATGGPSHDPDGDGLGRSARRLGAVALGVALVVPLALPGVGNGLLPPFGDGNGFGSGRGVTVLPPMVTLERRLQADVTTQLLQVTTTTPDYLRLTALDRFDGTQFTLSDLHADTATPVSEGLPPVGGPVPPSTPVRVDVKVSDRFAESYLPVPYAVDSVTGGGDWLLSNPTRTVFSTKDDTRGLRYTADAEVPAPGADLLRSADDTVDVRQDPRLAMDLDLGSGVSQRVRRLAMTITSGTTNPFDKAMALQEFFTDTPARLGPAFVYDLTAGPLSDRGALDRFLFTDRRGYCEQFASAMTVLARAVGIPARVAIGFTAGTQQPDGSYSVTNKDAHAWPELWFSNAGWVRFEPTPRSDGTAQAPAFTDPVVTPDTGVTSGTVTPTTPDTVTDPGIVPEPDAAAGVDVPGASAQPTSTGGGSDGLLAGLSTVGLVAVLALTPWFVRTRRRVRRLGRPRVGRWRPGRGAGAPTVGAPAAPPGRRGRGTAEAAIARAERCWAELVDTCADLGRPLSPSLSPRAAAQALAGAPGLTGSVGTAAREALDRLTTAVERARYAATPLAGGDLAGDVRLVRGALLGATAGGRRMRAVFLPRTVLAPAGRWVSAETTDLLGGVEGVTNRFAGLRRLARSTVSRTPGRSRGPRTPEVGHRA